MSSTKQLLEKANRKCEMRWRVLAFDPAKDNELVHTSKDAFDCIKMAGEYKMDLAKKHPDYIIEIIAESKEQKNEADKVFLKKIEDVLHRYNLPSAKIVDERKVDNTHYIYKIDVNSTDYAKSLKRDAVDFDKLKKDNALKALSFLEIDGIYPQRNSQSILMQINFRKGKPESSQKNEGTRVESYAIQNINSLKEATIKVKEICKPANLDIAEKLGLFYDGTINIAQYLPNSKQLVIFKESSQKNEVNYSSLEKFFKQKQKEVDSTAKKLEILKAKLEKAKNLLSKAKDRAVVVFYGGFEDVPLVAYAESFNDLKDAEELFSKIKSQSAASSYATSKGSFVSPIEAIELLYYQKTKEVVFFDKDFEKLYKSGFSSESSQKNEEKEFIIKLVTPFGKAKVCSWKANSVDAAVKEFLDANPAYRENKKGAVIAESAQKNEALNLDSLTDEDAKQLIQYLQDFIKDKSSKYYHIDKIEAILKKKYKAESISDDIVREVKEEVKDGVKDFVQQDVDAKLNGEITPKDYQANFEEDIDDDSDGIFGDELDNAEPDEPEQIKD